MNMTHLEPHARLRAARKAAGYKTAVAFLNASGVPASTYSQHESGARNIDDATFKQYAKLFNVELEWLMNGKGLPYKNKMDEKRSKTFAAETLDLGAAVATSPLISEQLLAAVLEELQKGTKKMKAKETAKAATVIYSEVVRGDGALSEQLAAVKLAVRTFLRLAK